MDLKKLNQQYNSRKKEIQKRLIEFKSVPKKDYFYEACFCILTPQSNAKKCWRAIEQLKKLNFQNKNISPGRILQKQTRFHNNKAKYLIELKNKWKFIEKTHEKMKDSKELREFLTNNIKGYGLKEASHYLRNIGYKNLAILDRHILKNLQKHNVIKEIPKTLTVKTYYDIENKFKEFATNLKIPMDELDLLFWSQETGKNYK